MKCAGDVAKGYVLAWDVAAGYALAWVRHPGNRVYGSSNEFSCALRGNHAPEIRHPDPDPGQR